MYGGGPPAYFGRLLNALDLTLPLPPQRIFPFSTIWNFQCSFSLETHFLPLHFNYPSFVLDSISTNQPFSWLEFVAFTFPLMSCVLRKPAVTSLSSDMHSQKIGLSAFLRVGGVLWVSLKVVLQKTVKLHLKETKLLEDMFFSVTWLISCFSFPVYWWSKHNYHWFPSCAFPLLISFPASLLI